MNKILLLLLCFVIIACAMQIGEEKLKDKKGKKALKNMQPVQNKFVIGVSTWQESESEALQSAMLNARIQIVESLGLKVEIRSFEQVKGSTGSMNIDKKLDLRSSIYAKSILSTEYNQYYTEKWMEQAQDGIRYKYKSWVKIEFSKEKHKQYWLGFLRDANAKFTMKLSECRSNTDEAEKISALMNLLKSYYDTEKDFSDNFWLVREELYNKFIVTGKEISEEIMSEMNNVRIIVDSLRDDNFVMRVNYHDKPLRNYPVYISSPELELDHNFISGRKGEILIPVHFKDARNADVRVYAGLKEIADRNAIIIPDQRFCIVSPLNKAGFVVGIKMNPESYGIEFRDTILKNFKDQGFTVKLGESTDKGYQITCDISTEFQKSLKSYPGYIISKSFYDIKVVRVPDQEIIYTYSIPNDRYRDTRGFGLTEKKSVTNAVNLKNLSLKNDFFSITMRNINEYIERDIKERTGVMKINQ